MVLLWLVHLAIESPQPRCLIKTHLVCMNAAHRCNCLFGWTVLWSARFVIFLSLVIEADPEAFQTNPPFTLIYKMTRQPRTNLFLPCYTD